MRSKPKNQFKVPDFCQTVRKRYRRRFKKGMNAKDSEIMKVINDWLDEVKEQVVKGKKVILNKHSYIQVIGTPILQSKPYVNLSRKGFVLTPNGVRKAKGLPKRKDFIYGIKYVNSQTREKIYFEPHPEFSKRVHKALEETNTYFHIQ